MLSQALAALGVLAAGIGLVRRSHERERTSRPRTLAAFRAVDPDRSRERDRLWFSVEALRSERPDLSADRTVTAGQYRALVAAAAVVAAAIVLAPNAALVVVMGLVILLYAAALVTRLVLFGLALNGQGTARISDEAARAMPDAELPTFSVLVPAYGEPEVLGSLIHHLGALEYPSDRLEILLLLEQDDLPTIEEARRLLAPAGPGRPDGRITIVEVPPVGPRTKPKALNYGLAGSSGQIVSIFDAEDRPEPLQLRKAAVALAAAPPQIACVQARLDFFNPRQNLLTRWFTLDYRMWFTRLLPGLSQLGAPIPLGGTSNHFRRAALIEVGAWDPRNVTEDADLGLRLQRAGYRTGVVDSVTYEEANSDLVNWVKQRSRWYKGYAQTALVHLRNPLALFRSLGFGPSVLFLLLVAGTPLIAVLNPVFWLVTIVWFVWHPHPIEAVFPTFTYFAGQICWIGGNLAVLYSWMLSTREPRERLWLAAILSPLYWVLMSIAAVKAMVQLVTAPSYWEKTQHGLAEATTEAAA